MNHDLNTALQGRIQSQEDADEGMENKKSTQNGQIGKLVSQNKEDGTEAIKEEEKNNLNDSNILHYDVPKFREQQILGKL